MKTLFTKLAVLALLVVGAFTANAHTHAIYVVHEADGSITFYAETYKSSLHGAWDGSTPIGSMQLVSAGGAATTYDFTSVVTSLPSGATMTARCEDPYQEIRYQVVNVAKCSGTYRIRTLRSRPYPVSDPRCSYYGAVTFAGISVAASTDADPVYYGYAPLACANLTATSAGATSYTWSTGATGATTNVCPTSTTTYTVTASSGIGCTATASVTVNVIDVRGGKKMDKVVMCKPTGKSGKLVPIVVDESAVPAQLSTGATLGPCPQSKYELEGALESGINVYPNPFADHLNFQFIPKSDEHVRIEAFDITGKSLGILFDKDVEASVYYNGIQKTVDFPQGIIMLRYTSATEVRVLKIHHQ